MYWDYTVLCQYIHDIEDAKINQHSYELYSFCFRNMALTEWLGNKLQIEIWTPNRTTKDTNKHDKRNVNELNQIVIM